MFLLDLRVASTADEHHATSARPGIIRGNGAVAWATFFLWIGIVMLANVSWGWFLLGVGILTLAIQSARWQMNMKIEGFWVACGAVFLAGGLWTLLNLPWPFVPILLILLGVALLGKTVIDVRR
jgi:hypothetical protein